MGNSTSTSINRSGNLSVNSGTPWWAWTLVIGGAILLFIIIILLILILIKLNNTHKIKTSV